MRENIWYTVARTSDKECVGRVLFSIGSTELVFDNLIQFGNISISIVRAAVEADTVFSMRIRSHGGFYYVDIRSSREYTSDPVFSVDQILNTLVALPFAQAGSGKQECIVSTDAYAPAPDGRTYVTLDTVQAITALKYFENGLAIGTMDRYWPLLFGEDGIYLGDKRVLVTTDIAGFVNGGSYNSTTKYIELKHDNTTVARIDARAFIKDGMVDSVVVDNGYLVITFNTDSGKEPISISLSKIFDPANYYTKPDIDTLLGSYVNSLEQGAGNYVIGISKDGNKLSVSRGTLPTKLSDFIDDVVAGNYLPIHGTADKALRLSDDTAHTAWGQTFWQNGVPKTISGNISGAGNITGSGLITMPKGKFSSSLIIPHVAPSGTLESGETYLYSGTGEYAEIPEGGGVADIYDLTIRKNGSLIGTYNLGEQAANVNIPIGWGDLTEDSSHRFLTDTLINTWDAKQDAISDLATIRAGAALGATALQSETDPVFSASAASGITSNDISAWNAKYDKPSGGIPKSDLATSVQTSLGKADTALQSESDPTVPAWAKKTSLAASDVPTLAISKISGLQDALDGKQPLDADLTAIAALTGSGLLRRNSNNTWSLDTNTYLTDYTIYPLTVKNSGGVTELTYNPKTASGEITLTKAMVGLGNVENTALSTWAGSNNITTLGTITAGVWHGSKIANAYLANSSVTINGKSVSLGGSVSLNLDDIGDGTSRTWDRIVFTDTVQTITGKKTMTNVSVTGYLAVPKIAPASPVTGDIYLWADANGNYSEIPGGGGVADIYDLTVRKNGTSLGTYNLGTAAADINIPIGWADLTEDSSHKFVSQSEKDTWSAKMSKMQAIPYIEGPTTDTTAGIWTGAYEGITALEEGLTIIYVSHVAGASTTTLNINGLGAKTCYWTGTSKMTTQYPVGTPILLTYSNNGWRRADSNTTYSAGTKALFDAGANTTNRVWSAKVLADSVAPIVHTHTWSDITDGADVLSGYLPLSGGELTGNLSMGRNAIINIGSLSAPPDETFTISGVRSISFAIGGAFLPLPGIVKDGNHLVFYTGYADVHDTVGEDLYHLKLTAAEEGSGEDWGGGSYKIYDESNLSLATLAGSSAIGSTSQPVYYNGSALAACNLGTASQKDAVTTIISGGAGLPTADAIYTFVNNAVTAAQPYKGVSSTAVTDGGTEMPTISGYITRTKGDVVAYNKKEFIWEGDKWRELGDEGSYALKTVQVIAGTGLAGGGAISQDVTLSLSSETIASLGLADSALQASDLDGYVNAISQGSGNYVTGITKSGKTLTITRATLPTTIALSNVTGADDLKAIEALTGTSGFLKKTAANTWTLDTNTYLTSANHKALTLKVGSITIRSDYNSLAEKTYTITKANLTDTIGTTTYAPYHADGYLPLSGGTLTGTLYTQHILPSSALGGYNIGSETAPFGSGYFSGSLLAEESVETYDVIAHGTADLSVRLAIPTSAPTSPASGKTYLWASSLGDYAETPSGGGSATVYDLTIRKNGTAIGTYNLGTQAADVNIPVGWSDLTPDARHRFLTDSLISTWNGKQDAISDLATIRSNASHGNTAYGWGDHSQAGYLTSFTETDPTVPAWAKASTKPTYTLDEVADGSTRKLANYLPLTAGSGKALTGDLYLNASSAARAIYATTANGNMRLLYAASAGNSISVGTESNDYTYINSGGGVYLQATASGTTHQVYLSTGGFFAPGVTDSITLGASSRKWKALYATTLYGNLDWSYIQNKPTLDNIADGTTRKLSNYLPLTGGTLTGGLALSNVNQTFDVSTTTRNIYYKASDAVSYRGIIFGTNGDLTVGYDGPAHSRSLYLDGFNEYLRFGSTKQYSVKLNSTGTVELSGISAVLPATTNEVNLGSSAKAFNNIYGKLDLSYVQSASDLKAIEALAGTGLAKRTADNTWELTDTADKAGELVTFSEEDAMFNYRQVPSAAQGDVLKATAVKGKSIVWNQLVKGLDPTRLAQRGLTGSFSSGVVTLSGTVSSAGYIGFTGLGSAWIKKPSRKILLRMREISGTTTSSFFINEAWLGIRITPNSPSVIYTTRTDGAWEIRLSNLAVGDTFTDYTFGFECIDLTAAGLDDLTAAGFEALYPDYHAYNAGELVNNAASGIEMLGFNRWDEQWEKGAFNTTTGVDTNVAGVAQIRSGYIPIEPSTQYYISQQGFTGNDFIWALFYDSSKTIITGLTAANVGGIGKDGNAIRFGSPSTIITPTNAAYFRFYRTATAGSDTYDNNICLNLFNASLNGQYKPYKTSTLSTPITEIVPADKPTVRLNQHIVSGTRNGASASVTMAKSGTRYTFNGTATRTATFFLDTANDMDRKMPIGHKGYYSYRIVSGSYTGSWNVGSAYAGNTPLGKGTSVITTYSGAENYPYIYCTVGASASSLVIEAMCIDLTEMYGAGNEPTSTAEVEELIGSGYIPYTTGEDIPNRIFPKGMKSAGSVADEWSGTTAIKRIGVVDLGTLNWVTYTYDDKIVMRANELNNIARIDNTTANFICTAYPSVKGNAIGSAFRDGSPFICISTFLGYRLIVYDAAYTDAATFKAAMSGVYLYYELATPVTYTTDQLPDTLVPFESGGTQKVIPTYDIVSGGEKVFPDGPNYINESVYDEYYDTTAIKRVGVVDMGTLSYAAPDYSGNNWRIYAYLGAKPAADNNVIANISCARYTPASNSQTYSHTSDKILSINSSNGAGLIYDTSLSGMTSAQIKAALSGVLLYYELTEPITYTLDHTLVQAPMVCDFQYGANISDVAKAYLPLSGGTLTGALNSQNILPSATATYDLGSYSKRFKDLYLAGTATVNGIASSGNILASGEIRLSANNGKVVVEGLGGLFHYNDDDGDDFGLVYLGRQNGVEKIFVGTDDEYLDIVLDGHTYAYEADVANSLSIPTAAPSNPVSTKVYLWCDTTGNYYQS